jgi:hypothetical protein
MEEPMNDGQQIKHTEGMNYSISLAFEPAYLPPFRDILVIGKRCSLGANGVSRSLELLVPNGFIMHDIDNPNVSALIINRTILKRISAEKIMEILESRVFPYMSDEEIIKVDFDIMIRYDSFDVDTK